MMCVGNSCVELIESHSVFECPLEGFTVLIPMVSSGVEMTNLNKLKFVIHRWLVTRLFYFLRKNCAEHSVQ